MTDVFLIFSENKAKGRRDVVHGVARCKRHQDLQVSPRSVFVGSRVVLHGTRENASSGITASTVSRLTETFGVRVHACAEGVLIVRESAASCRQVSV